MHPVLKLALVVVGGALVNKYLIRRFLPTSTT